MTIELLGSKNKNETNVTFSKCNDVKEAFVLER